MKLIGLSHYDSDLDTRFGDCFLIYSSNGLTIYDCGHEKHADYVKSFLSDHKGIKDVCIVVSHNDSDHTDGVCCLIEWLAKNGYSVSVYSHQYLKHVDAILDKIDDGRRNRESLKEALLAEFDKIKEIIEKAEEYGFETVEALCGTKAGDCEIVGPTIEEFTDVAAKAVDNRENNTIGEGDAEETVMNAASVQIKLVLDNGSTVLLCGDASPDYLKELKNYNYIQLPHHGQLSDAKAVFSSLGEKVYLIKYIISDNTGSSKTSGGSDDLVKYMKKEKYSPAFNTKNGILFLPGTNSSVTESQRRSLGVLGCI